MTTKKYWLPVLLFGILALCVLVVSYGIRSGRSSDSPSPTAALTLAEADIMENDSLLLFGTVASGRRLTAEELGEDGKLAIWTFLSTLEFQENFSGEVRDGMPVTLYFTLENRTYCVRLRGTDNIEVLCQRADGNFLDSAFWSDNGKESGSRYSASEEALAAVLALAAETP